MGKDPAYANRVRSASRTVLSRVGAVDVLAAKVTSRGQIECAHVPGFVRVNGAQMCATSGPRVEWFL
jgi:hypothetical protein